MADFDIFYQAAKALLSGQSPYIVHGFFNPVWALIPFIPLTILPVKIAEAAYTLITISGTFWALHRFGLKPLEIAIVALLSPLLWINIIAANVDWIVLLGASLSPKWGVWLCGVKPQMSFGVFGLWTWKKHWKPLALICFALILNYAILGIPDLKTSNSLTGNGNGYSASLFPIGIPVAIYWIVLSIRRNSSGVALAISAMCSPYYSLSSAVSLAPLANSRKGTVGVMLISWALFFLWKYAIKI